MRWHIDLIHIISSIFAAVGLWTVALAVRVALESRKEDQE